MKMNFEKRRREIDCVDESEIVLNRHFLVSILDREFKENVPLKPPATSPLTISCVSSKKCQIYICTEKMYLELFKLELFSSQLYCLVEVDSSLFSRFTTNPILYEQFISSTIFVQFSHCSVQI